MAILKTLCLVALALPTLTFAAPQAASGTTAVATTATSSAAASTSSAWGKAADNLIFAQQIVYDLLAKHSDLYIVGMHGIPPGQTNGTTFAINLDRIGKADDSDDDAVAVDHKTIMAPNVAEPFKFEIATPMFDTSDTQLNASINFVFHYSQKPEDQAGLYTKAIQYRKEVQARIPGYAILFASIKAFNVTTLACY